MSNLEKYVSPNGKYSVETDMNRNAEKIKVTIREQVTNNSEITGYIAKFLMVLTLPMLLILVRAPILEVFPLVLFLVSLWFITMYHPPKKHMKTIQSISFNGESFTKGEVEDIALIIERLLHQNTNDCNKLLAEIKNGDYSDSNFKDFISDAMSRVSDSTPLRLDYSILHHGLRAKLISIPNSLMRLTQKYNERTFNTLNELFSREGQLTDKQIYDSNIVLRELLDCLNLHGQSSSEYMREFLITVNDSLHKILQDVDDVESKNIQVSNLFLKNKFNIS